MMTGLMGVVPFALLILIAYALWERWRHEHHLRQIPLRILVTGSRGKSSITRLIAAGLRAGNIRAAAKTSGSATRYIDVKGRETEVVRSKSADIREQFSIIRRAAQEDAQAVVLECMSLQPFLQRIEAQKIVRPHLIVIARIAPDHLDLMGPNVEAVAKTYASSICAGSLVFSLQGNYQQIVEQACRRVHAELMPVDPDSLDCKNGGHDFYLEHGENLALSQAVCRHAGVSDASICCGFSEVEPDVGALRILTRKVNDQVIRYVHAFAANDPESILRIWSLPEIVSLRRNRPTIVFCHTRSDRPHRSRQIAKVAGAWIEAERLLISGKGTKDFIRWLPAEMRKKSDRLQKDDVTVVIRALEPFGPDVCLFGIGNIDGLGIRLLDFMASDREIRQS
ncbi:poly-gamma-glutamate synthase PgsB [candidate division KSB1 bacterium]|nr:poly-gamma-glutamate synthase PgsB [candidate division KSB1 bacterium]